MDRLLLVGFETYIPISSIITITNHDSAPIKRMIEEAKRAEMMIDATFGRKTRCAIITNSKHVILSAISIETMVKRYHEVQEKMVEDKALNTK